MDQKSAVGIRDAQIINEDLYLFSSAGNVVRNIELVESSMHSSAYIQPICFGATVCLLIL